MQSLCTLRNHCCQWPRNTRYQADATPYLGRTATGWIAPALPGALTRASPFDHGIGEETSAPCDLWFSAVRHGRRADVLWTRRRRYCPAFGLVLFNPDS